MQQLNKIFKLMLLVIMISFPPLYANQTTDQCKADFDKKIADMKTLKNSAETFINGAKDKKETIKKAYKEVDAYEKKIRLLLRNNLIKSLLKLGFNTFQEITPLSNSGKVLDVIMWFKDKAQDYVLSTEAISQNDYYDSQIASVSDDCKNLTSDVKLLSQMSKAGLEAFKTKIQREQNKTVGNVGALYTKLSALLTQSEKAKRSLYNFYLQVNNLVVQYNDKFSDMDTLISSYITAKDNTCKEHSSTTTTVTVKDYNSTKITFPAAINDDYCEAQKASDIIDEQDSIFTTLSKTFHDKLTNIEKNSAAILKNLSNQNNKLVSSYSLNDVLFSLAGGHYDTSVLSCNFINYNKMSNVEENSLDYYTKLKANLNTTIEIFKKNMKAYDTLDKYLQQNEYKTAIENDEKKIRTELKCGEGLGDNIEDQIEEFEREITASKQEDMNALQNIINKVKTIQNAIDKMLPNTENAIDKCLANAEKIVQHSTAILKSTGMNRVDEYIMAKRNLFDYLKELRDKHIITFFTEYGDSIYDINTSYFQPMYDNFKGNDIEFLEKVKNFILPIRAKLSKLYNYYINKKDLVGEDQVYIPWHVEPYINIKEKMKNFGELAHEIYKVTREPSLPKSSLSVLSSMEDYFIKGDLSYIHTEPFRTIVRNLYLENQQKNIQLARLTDDLKNGFYKDINGYKKAKQSLDKIRDFYYQLGQVYNGYIKDDEIAKAQKALHTQAKSSLPAMQAEQFDYSKPQVYKTPEPMELNISNSSIDLPSLSNSKVTVNINTAYDIKVILTALDDSNKSLKLTPSWSKDMESSEYKDKNFTLQIDSLDNKDATYTITLKLEDYNAALFGSPYLQPYITKTITVNVFSDKKTISLKKGWNLISGSIDLSSLPKDIDIIWSYDDGFWSGFSPFDYLQKLIFKVSIGSNINPMKSISDNVGIWIHSLKEQNVQILLKNSTKIQKIIKKSGWNLIGTKNEIQVPDDLSCSDNRILKAVWRYDSNDKSWQNYQKDSNISTLKNIGENEGFWVLCM